MTQTPVVLITGSEGFIGRQLSRLLSEKFAIIGIDIEPQKSNLPYFRFHQGDITDRSFIREVFESLEKDVQSRLAGIIHLAWYYDFSNDLHPAYDRFVDTLPDLVKYFDSCAPQSSPFIFASSMAAMQCCPPGERQSESWPVHSPWHYPASKTAAGDRLRKITMKRPILEMVLAAVYSDWCELVPLFMNIERIRTKDWQRFFFPGSTKRGLTYVHRDDVVSALKACLETKSKPSGVSRFLIGEAEPVVNQEIFDLTTSFFAQRKVPFFKVPKWLARWGSFFLGLVYSRQFVKPWMIAFSEEHFEFDTAKAKALLNWHPKHNLTETLTTILDRAKNEPEQWLAKNEARPWRKR